MKKPIKLTLVVSAVTLLAACVVDGGTNQTTINTGDYTSYSLVRSPTEATSGSPTTQWFTRYITDVKSSGAYTTAVTYSDNTRKYQLDYNEELQETSYTTTVPITSTGPSTTTCINSPMVDSPTPPFKVGKTWDIRFTRTCYSSNTSSVRSERNYGSVISEEKKSVPAGIFDTAKLQYTRISTNSDGTSESRYTCWREKENNRTVACDYTSKYTPSGTSQASSSYSYEQKLQYFNIATSSQNKPGIARFAGNWTAKSSNTDTCYLTVGVTGTITGNCYRSGDSSTYSATGNVNNDGIINAMTSSGTTITGKLNNPLAGAGSWTNSGTSSSWNAQHD
jgi:hypothetical protein